MHLKVKEKEVVVTPFRLKLMVEVNSEPLRIDYIFTTKDVQVEKLHVVFDEKNSPQVSDHYGLQATLSWKD